MYMNGKELPYCKICKLRFCLLLFMQKNKATTPDWEPTMTDAKLRYFKQFITKPEADRYFHLFSETIPWRQENVKVFGKIYPQPRLTALHSIEPKSYTYSGLTLQAQPMTDALLILLASIENISDSTYNCVLLNLYRDGQDSNGWHADNEKELGKHPQIASISLGANRNFHLKHRRIRSEKHKMELHHGSLLLMEGAMQEHWLHQIPKTAKAVGPRINLTFRKFI